MFKKINNWHLSVLIAIVSIFSLVLIQQYAIAQNWTDPGDLPGNTPNNNLVVNPMVEDLQVGGNDIKGTYLNIDASDADSDNKVIKVSSGKEICFGDTDCASAWPVAGGGGFWSMGVNPGVIYYDGGYVGIGTAAPNKQLHVANSSGNAEIDISSGTNNHWGIYQDNTTADLRLWNVDNKFTFTNEGRFGIGTTTPNSALTVWGKTAGASNVTLQNDAGDMRLVFKEYYYTSRPNGDISLRYYSGTGLYDNWLEFWGRRPDNTTYYRPIMTMQRDYEPSANNYRGVGIGVPSATAINTTLRVQNTGLEDILQLYDDDAMTFQVTDGGRVGIGGAAHDGVPVYINGTGTNGLKIYSYGLYSYNNPNLQLKATNDIYLDPGPDDGVGISVVNPQQILHVKNLSTFPDTLLRLENNTNGTFSNQTTQIEFVRGPNRTTDYSWIGPTDEDTFDIWTMENVPMLFGVSGNQSMKISGAQIVMDGWPATGWAGNGAKLNVRGYGNSGVYSEGNPGVWALADDTGSAGGGNGSFIAGYFNGDVHVAPKMGHVTDSGFLVLNGYGGVDPAQCTEAAHMGRVHFDKINGILYFCVGDPGSGIPGAWKSLTL